jgi:hypothetical protein
MRAFQGDPHAIVAASFEETRKSQTNARMQPGIPCKLEPAREKIDARPEIRQR